MEVIFAIASVIAILIIIMTLYRVPALIRDGELFNKYVLFCVVMSIPTLIYTFIFISFLDSVDYTHESTIDIVEFSNSDKYIQYDGEKITGHEFVVLQLESQKEYSSEVIGPLAVMDSNKKTKLNNRDSIKVIVDKSKPPQVKVKEPEFGVIFKDIFNMDAKKYMDSNYEIIVPE